MSFSSRGHGPSNRAIPCPYRRLTGLVGSVTDTRPAGRFPFACPQPIQPRSGRELRHFLELESRHLDAANPTIAEAREDFLALTTAQAGDFLHIEPLPNQPNRGQFESHKRARIGKSDEIAPQRTLSRSEFLS